MAPVAEFGPGIRQARYSIMKECGKLQKHCQFSDACGKTRGLCESWRGSNAGCAVISSLNTFKCHKLFNDIDRTVWEYGRVLEVVVSVNASCRLHIIVAFLPAKSQDDVLNLKSDAANAVFNEAHKGVLSYRRSL